MKKLSLILIIAVFLVSSNYSNAQGKNLKVGVVDVEMIVQQLPEAVEADKKLQELAKTYRDSLKALQQQYSEKMQNYNKQKSMMTPEQKQQEEAALKQLEMTYAQFQQQKLGNQGELAQKREELLAPIREKIQDAIKKISKKENLDIVLDKGSPIVLYAEDKLDVTFSALDLLKRGKK